MIQDRELRLTRHRWVSRLIVFIVAVLGPSSGIASHPEQVSDGLYSERIAQNQQLQSSQPDGGNEDPHAAHKKALVSNNGNRSANADIEIAEGFNLHNQFGETVDLRRDVIGDRIAVIDFVYTNCTTVCPVVSTIFSQLQERLGRYMEDDVALVTITVDPTRDTPHRMMSYSQNFQPGPNWIWLTGEKRIMDKVLFELGAYTPLFEDHPAMVLVGDENNSQWYRFYGFPAPEAIESKVMEMLAHRKH